MSTPLRLTLTACALCMLMASAACKTGAPSSTSEGAQTTCQVPGEGLASGFSSSAELDDSSRYDDVVEREVRFESRGSTLLGTLTLPRTEQSHQMPGVVILQDWGKSTRRGVVEGSLGIDLPVEVPLYETLAHQLARSGFAVLRFDKRNCVQDTSPHCHYARAMLEAHLDELGEVLVSDAEAALATLRQQPEVSPARVAIVGHGQGAELALATTRSVSPPGAVVLLSPSMSPIHEVITYQTRYSLDSTREQLTRQADDPLADLLRQQIQMLEEDERAQKKLFSSLNAKPSGSDPSTIYGLPTRTWRSFHEVHQRALAALSDERRPALLAVLGALDADLPESNAQRLTELLGALPGTRLELLSDTTHDMVYIDSDTPDPPTLHPGLSAQISAFLSKALTRP